MKKVGCLFLLVVLVISFSSAYTHNASNIYLKINGADTNLQTAITLGNFTSSYIGGSYSSAIWVGHNVINIIVNVNGTNKTLSAAILDGTLSNTVAGKSPAVYTGYNMTYGEYGTNVSIVNRSGAVKSLQTAINDGEFYVCVDTTWGPSDGCYGVYYTQTSNCGRTRTSPIAGTLTATEYLATADGTETGDSICAMAGRGCISAILARGSGNFARTCTDQLLNADNLQSYATCTCVTGTAAIITTLDSNTITGNSKCTSLSKSCQSVYNNVGTSVGCSGTYRPSVVLCSL